MNYRKPKSQKVIQGTWRADRNPMAEPEPLSVITPRKPPSFLNKYGKCLWQDVVDELIRTGVLTTIDWAVFELCCDAYGQFREARDAIYNPINFETGLHEKRTLSEYMTGRNSQTMPEYTAMNKGREEFLKFANVLGLNPVSRNRIDIVKHNDHKIDPMEELLNERYD